MSFKPDHGHQGALHNETAYGVRANGEVVHRVALAAFKSAEELAGKVFADESIKTFLLERTAGLSGRDFAEKIDSLGRAGGPRRVRLLEKLSVIEIRSERAIHRHGQGPDGRSLPYKGYKGDSNYCIEIWRDEKGGWKSTVISTFEAYAIERESGLDRLRHPTLSQSNRPLVMRLMINDMVRFRVAGDLRLMRVATISGNGQIFFAEHVESNVDARNREHTFRYISKMAGSLRVVQARRVGVSCIGELRDPGFLD